MGYFTEPKVPHHKSELSTTPPISTTTARLAVLFLCTGAITRCLLLLLPRLLTRPLVPSPPFRCPVLDLDVVIMADDWIVLLLR